VSGEKERAFCFTYAAAEGNPDGIGGGAKAEAVARATRRRCGRPIIQ